MYVPDVETHMLDSMGHARHVIFITEASNIYIQGSTGLVRRRIMHQESLKLIGETDDPVATIIKRRLLQLIGDPLNSG